MADWVTWIEEVKRLAKEPDGFTYEIQRDLLDLFSEGCSPQEAVSLMEDYSADV